MTAAWFGFCVLQEQLLVLFFIFYFLKQQYLYDARAYISTAFDSIYIYFYAECLLYSCFYFTFLAKKQKSSLWSPQNVKLCSVFLKIILPFALLKHLFQAVLGILVFITLNFHSLPFPVNRREVRGGTRTLIWFSVWSDRSESFYRRKKKKKTPKALLSQFKHL